MPEVKATNSTLTLETAGVTLLDGVAGAEIVLYNAQVPTGEVWEFPPSSFVFFDADDLAAASLALSGTLRIKKADSNQEQTDLLLDGQPGDFEGTITDSQQHYYFGKKAVLKPGQRFLITHFEPIGGSGCDISTARIRIPFNRHTGRI